MYELIKSWERHLRAENKARKTIVTYTDSARQMADHLDGKDIGAVTSSDIADWIAHLLDTRSASTASVRFRALQQFFGWLEREDELERNPMVTLRPPAVPEKPVPVVSEADMRALLKTCDARSFVGRRDAAILRVLYDGGLRLAECAGLSLGGVDLDSHPATLLVQRGAKNRRARAVAVGVNTEQALDKYLRARSREKRADLDALWLGENGRPAMTDNGIGQMVRRRGREIGLKVNPHMFRHSLAHEWRVAGGGDDELMRTMGWRSRSMLARYGASAAEERAREARGRLQLPGDRI